MKKFPKWLVIILAILAPLGLTYLILHTMSRDFKCFLTVILTIGIGILLGIYIISPETILHWIDVVNIFN
jgi:hypothetical protein